MTPEQSESKMSELMKLIRWALNDFNYKAPEQYLVCIHGYMLAAYDLALKEAGEVEG